MSRSRAAPPGFRNGAFPPGATDARGALDNARDLAAHAESWGYRRFWVAELHNMPGIASAATSIVICHITAGTKSIRIGAGGIMLPNHAPIVIAEQFGTLARLFPGRIDLGLGRAPGTDQMTVRALRRSLESADKFPQDVLELQAYFAPAAPEQRLQAVPAAGTEVPLWILGSSTFDAYLAAELGLPYAFASHFAPEQLMEALDIYRSRFKSSEQLDKPHAMAGINIIAAESDREAKRLATTQQMSLRRCKRRWAEEGRFLTGRTARPESERLPPGQHLVRNWPVLDLGEQPEISPDDWRLTIVGAVEHPAMWTWEGPGLWEANGYHNRGDPWQEQRYSED